MAVYVSEFLSYSLDDTLSADFFYISVTLNFKDNDKYDNFKLHAYYQWDFLRHLESALDNNDRFSMLAGDINFDLFKFSSSNAALPLNEYVNILRRSGLKVSNDRITRPYSSTLIDHAAFRCDDEVLIHNVTISNEISDHNPVISHILFPHKHHKYKFVEKRFVDYAKVNSELFNLFGFSERPKSNDVNELYDYLLNTLNRVLGEFTTTRMCKVKRSYLRCPYVNDHLESWLIMRSTVWTRYKRNRSNGYLRVKLDALDVMISHLQAQCKLAYYEN